MFAALTNFIDKLTITKVVSLSISNKYLNANFLLNQYKVFITETSALNAINDKEEKAKIKAKYLKLLLRLFTYNFEGLNIEFMDNNKNLVFSLAKIKNYKLQKVQYTFIFWFTEYLENNKEKLDIIF